ncbi:hypothetical protein HPB49_021057 [Dermacentor silvarum]|uniref:Uncharacterized protein n=1 Tax=Dermacentor silvarum TaxID=543639 RepID=A0ACB8D7P7_DERSI|nr:hypothetical protein HPB49_021057 [Dermacentor silvarum]
MHIGFLAATKIVKPRLTFLFLVFCTVNDFPLTLEAAKAVDCLLESPWATGKPKVEQLFTTRESVVEFMNTLLQHKFFHRAKKIIVTKPKKKKDDDDTGGGTPKATREKKKKDEADGSASKEGAEEKKEVEEIKKKLKLDMHLDQYFVDANEPYVWIYDPVPLRTWIIGTLLVVGAVAVCLFPLWPRTVRDYVYYLSIATAFLLGIIISLAFCEKFGASISGYEQQLIQSWKKPFFSGWHSGFVVPDSSDAAAAEVLPNDGADDGQDFGSVLPDAVTHDDYIGIDDGVTTAGSLTDEQIVKEVIHGDESENEEELQEEQPHRPPRTVQEAAEALVVLEEFCFGTADSMRAAEHLEGLRKIVSTRISARKQTSIRDYFVQ